MLYTTQWFTAMMGDITLGWTDDQADMMTEIIQKKMDEGFVFFVKDEDNNQEIRLKTIASLKGRNSVIIGDKDAELLIREGKIGIVDVSGMVESEPSAEVIETSSEVSPKPMRRARSAREAATSQTVATPRKAGG